MPEIDTPAQTEETAVPAPEPERSPAEDETPKKMHNFSAYIHVGPDAESCDCIVAVGDIVAPNGRCADPEHFHAWIRLPNQFEKKSIADKAGAAEARRIRAFRDPNSNGSVMLDNEIEGIVLGGDKEALIDEIVGKDFLEDHLQAVREISDEDADEDGEWATIEEDRDRLNALRGKLPEDRDEEEFEQLDARITAHAELVNERRDVIQAPKRGAVADKPIEELGQIVRQVRVEAIANGTRREESLKWEMYVCTMKPKDPSKPGFPSERAYPSIDAFVMAPAEVLEKIAETVTQLNQDSAAHLKG